VKSIVRFLLHRYWRLSRGLTMGVRGIVLDEAGRVLLVRHTYTRGWHLPGGGVEPGETAREALARELLEEAAVRVTAAPSLHGVFFNRRVAKRDHVLVYIVRAYEVIGPKAPDREIAEARLFPADALPPEATGPTRRRIGEVLGRPEVLPDIW